jgi:hypothetical protein
MLTNMLDTNRMTAHRRYALALIGGSALLYGAIIYAAIKLL